MQTEAIYGVLIPFLGTSLGAACVFFLKKSLGDLIQRALTGFAAGVMVAASIWSLIIPAIERSAGLGRWAFAPAAVGFWIGVLFLLGLDESGKDVFARAAGNAFLVFAPTQQQFHLLLQEKADAYGIL